VIFWRLSCGNNSSCSKLEYFIETFIFRWFCYWCLFLNSQMICYLIMRSFSTEREGNTLLVDSLVEDHHVMVRVVRGVLRFSYRLCLDQILDTSELKVEGGWLGLSKINAPLKVQIYTSRIWEYHFDYHFTESSGYFLQFELPLMCCS
jgi:hypothetical protein